MNELNEASMGSALLTQLGKKLNPFDKSGESQMSIKDRMKQQQFVQDFIGRVSVNLAQGIQGGLIDPNPKAGSSPQAASQPQAQAPQAQAPQAPQAQAPSSNTPAAPKQQPATVTPATPAQVRQQKQAAATATARQQMAPVSKLPANQTAIQAANVRKQKQAAATRNLGQVKESQFLSLNNVFESIMNLDEAGQYSYTISSYLENFLKQYMKGANTSALKPLIDAVQATYSQDKGKKALQKLASSAYSLYWTGGAGTEETPADASAPTTVGGALAAGLKQGLSQPTSSPADTASAVAGQSSDIPTSSSPTSNQPNAGKQDLKSVYTQAKEIIGQLNKQQKGYILRALEKELGMPSSSPAKPAQSAGQGAFGQMATQLSKPTASSTGGTTTTTGTGVTHKAGRGTKVKQTTPVATKAKVAAPTVAESKIVKQWGIK